MKARDFSLRDKDGKLWTLSKMNSEYIVLYFYPKDNTPGCTLEALEFTRDLPKFKELGATIIGISGGNDKTKSKFCDKHKLDVLLLSDTDFKVSSSYGLYVEKSFMGRKYMGIERTTYIIDKNLQVLKVFEKVKPLAHSSQVLMALKELIK